MTRKSVVVVCPGRGTYNRDELGYLATHHADKTTLLNDFDELRAADNQVALTALDSASRYSLNRQGRGDNASALIYACAYADYLSIDAERYDIVAVTGNSMGWYTALACAGALGAQEGFRLVNTMGSLMQDALVGGQLLYPFVDENWCEMPGARAALIELTRQIPNLFVSIHLGGMLVFAGDEVALAACQDVLKPLHDRFPMRLNNHAGFHSPLQAEVSTRAKGILANLSFSQPGRPLIDGRGHVWLAKGSNLDDLQSYTLGHQVTEPFDFSSAIIHSLREFAPDNLIVLGPGTTLGGAVGQCLVSARWRAITCKQDFVELQQSEPFVLSMGMPEQRRRVTAPTS